MKFEIVDTQAIYHRLLDTPDAAARAAIFRDALIAPFAGIAQAFGGADPVPMFAQWGLSVDQFDADQRAQTQTVIDGLTGANGWQRAAGSLVRARDAFAPYADRIPLESTTFGLFVGAMSGPADDEGYTGFGGIPGYIMTVYSKATPSNLERIEACTVHELHHNVWGTINTKNFMTETTVADYMLMEGLAESFAAELYGHDKIGPWVTAFDESKLDATKATIHEHLNDTGFNTLRGYIFGDLPTNEAFGVPKLGVPAYTGYALGYRIVQAYLARSGGSVVDATFVPVEQLIEEAGFFA